VNDRPTRTKLRLGIVKPNRSLLNQGVTGKELHVLLALGDAVHTELEKPERARKRIRK